MKKQEALSIVKTLSNSTHLKSEKDEAVRIVLETNYAMYQMSRVHLCGIIDYIYETYMKERSNEEKETAE